MILGKSSIYSILPYTVSLIFKHYCYCTNVEVHQSTLYVSDAIYNPVCYYFQALVVDSMLSIPRQLHNAVIGPKGKLVRMVMDECGGVRITFPPSESKSDDIKLHGPKEDVEKARRMLQELADEQVE